MTNLPKALGLATDVLDGTICECGHTWGDHASAPVDGDATVCGVDEPCTCVRFRAVIFRVEVVGTAMVPTIRHREQHIARARELRDRFRTDLEEARAVSGGMLAFDPDGAIAEMIAGLDRLLEDEDRRPIPAFMSEALRRRLDAELGVVH